MTKSRKLHNASFIVLAVVMLLSTGCASTALKADNSQLTPEQIVQQEISNAAKDIQASLASLAKVEEAKAWKDEIPVTSYSIPEGPLGNHLTVDWVGPVAPAVETIATLIGYTMNVTGKQPPVPAMITVHAVDVPALRILENIGWQAGQRIVITVNPQSETVQVTYVGEDS